MNTKIVAAIAFALTTAACSSPSEGGKEAPELDAGTQDAEASNGCDSGPSPVADFSGGSYVLSFRRLSGNCSELSDIAIHSNGAPSDNDESCSASTTTTSGSCTAETKVRCPGDANTATLRINPAGTVASGIMTISSYSCSGEYRVNQVRVGE